MSMEHVPVLLDRVITGLAPAPGYLCIDATLGGAGYAEALLEATAPNGRLLGLDADPEAVERARARLARFAHRVTLVCANFRQMKEIALSVGLSKVNCIILDLGLSSFQLDSPERGFSFQTAGPLDMRMNPGQSLTAHEIVNRWPERDLADIIFRYGEEPSSRRIARAIVEARPLHTTTELAAVVSRVVGGRGDRQHIHPATRVFQALRIAVNDELGALEAVLPQIVELLAPAGRFGAVSFHSLEDRIVKRFIQQETRDCLCPPNLPVCRCGHRATLRSVTRKPLRPDASEIRANPRSRSARLRIAERL